MAKVYGRGSEWRRWDLHLHAPGTTLADEFGDWNEFVEAVEAADPSIAVVGITDYASIRTYKAFKERHDNGRMQNIALAIPNIEFRISPETKMGKGINLHLLVSPDDPDHLDRIDEALTRLIVKRGEEDIACNRPGLIRLGKMTKASLEGDAAYREGVNQFKVDFDVFRRWFETDQWLVKNAVVAVAAGSNDGASGLVDSGYKATRREIYRFAHIILSGNPTERAAWLGTGSIRDDEFELLRLPKAVVHGSDAHSIARLFNPEQNRYCWIKADPTFEGLRQILYEPEDRVWIAEAPPNANDARVVIDSIGLSATNDWFDEGREIPLNSGLVAIIGLKGSGKTALADLIAFSCGATLDGESSFVSRAQDHISGLSTELRWNGGETETACVPHGPGGALGTTVKYLPQKFVDQLCDGDVLSDDLQREVENVIFRHLDGDAQMGCEDFTELRDFRTAGIRDSRQDLKTQIRDASQDIAELIERQAAIQKKNLRRAQLPGLLNALARSLPKINSEAMRLWLQELTRLRERRSKITETVAALRATRQQVVDLERKLTTKVREVNSFWATAEQSLKRLGFTAGDISKLAPGWTVTSAVFKARRDAIDKQIVGVTGTVASTPPSHETAASLDAAIKKLEGELDIDKAKKAKIAEIGIQRQRLTDEKRRLDADAEWAEKSYKDERLRAGNIRLERYLSYFALLEEEKTVLQELYAPLKQALANQGTQEQKLDVVCRVNVDLAAWVARGAELFDLRKTGSFRYDAIEGIAKFKLGRAWAACDVVKIRAAIEECLVHIKETYALKNHLKTGFQPKDVAEWLFSVDHLDVTHAIRYEGKDLRLLSPGTKGIVLLILYLAVDRFDNRPLIVDQPDENLDNQSTYEILRKYFREAKQRRQIIIITHNPNLVINTDAEQVIVAESALRNNGLPTINYTYGSLECVEGDGPLKGSIREAVCRIMEGGRDAFKMREKRYGQVLNA